MNLSVGGLLDHLGGAALGAEAIYKTGFAHGVIVGVVAILVLVVLFKK